MDVFPSSPVTSMSLAINDEEFIMTLPPITGGAVDSFPSLRLGQSTLEKKVTVFNSAWSIL